MSEEQQEPIKEERDVDPFTRMMFGSPPRREMVEENPANKPEKANTDYYALMEQVDSIMESVNKLKPMLKEFSPLLDYFKK
ncbi:hypothetical protein [Sutcliffiella horikoshii]|uniref:hypothetical protein n=1 Tax=Sutcliffiella horikoshii TaxID=79883 RepID=UPI001F1C4765|nr:hypothetical protein [Sutcliffiella horikoshii]